MIWEYSLLLELVLQKDLKILQEQNHMQLIIILKYIIYL
jgi:hypothetical protein